MNEAGRGAPELVAAYRRRRGLTLKGLAALLGVSWGAVWRWEHGTRTPPGELLRLALIGLDVEQGWHDTKETGQ